MMDRPLQHGYPNCDCDLPGGDPECKILPPYEPPVIISKRRYEELLSCEARAAVTSSTYGDLVKTHPDLANLIESHVWDNLNASEQREWALDQLTAFAKRLDEEAAEKRRTQLLLGDAAREIPEVSGPVQDRIRVLRNHWSREFGVVEKALCILAASGATTSIAEALKQARRALKVYRFEALLSDQDDILTATEEHALLADGHSRD